MGTKENWSRITRYLRRSATEAQPGLAIEFACDSSTPGVATVQRHRSTATPNTSLGAPKGGWPIDSVGIAYRASDGGRGAYANLSGPCNFISFTTYPVRFAENGTLGRDRPRFGGPARIALRPTNEAHFQEVHKPKSFAFPHARKSRPSKRLWF